MQDLLLLLAGIVIGIYAERNGTVQQIKDSVGGQEISA